MTHVSGLSHWRSLNIIYACNLIDVYFHISARQVDFGRKTYLDDLEGDGYGSWNLSYSRSAQYADSAQYDDSVQYGEEEDSDYSNDDDDDESDEESDSDDVTDDVTGCTTGDNDVIECAAKTDQVSIND